MDSERHRLGDDPGDDAGQQRQRRCRDDVLHRYRSRASVRRAAPRGRSPAGPIRKLRTLSAPACCKSGPRRRRAVMRPTMSSGPRGAERHARLIGAERHGRRHGHRALHDGRLGGGARGFPARHERRSQRGDARHVGIRRSAAVADAIYPKRPVTPLVYACAPASQAVNYTIKRAILCEHSSGR